MKKKKILFVCLGNICRSPLAEGIFNHKIKKLNLTNIYEADSCGTANYHIGDLPDPRTRENAKQNGIELNHRGRQLKAGDLEHFDQIFVMDESNLQNTLRLDKEGKFTSKISLMRDFDTVDEGSDVPDPYYGGSQGFQNVFDILNRSIDHWLLNQNH